MANVKWCSICCYSDPHRVCRDGKIRCKKRSKWVDPFDTCEGFSYVSTNGIDRSTLRRIVDGKDR